MKDFMYTIVLCGYSLMGLQAQTVNIPDPNFKQALLDFTSTDTNNDGEIQVSEALAVDTLVIGDNWASYGIQDLTGIAYFTNLVYLDCHNNQIASLDLSQNTLLEELLCYDNQITNLNITQNAQLIDLYGGGNPLATIDVTNNTKLETLVLNQCNLLNVLDVSQNIKLKEIFCSVTQITNLDLTQNNQLIRLGLNTSSLTTLDIRNGTNSNLEYFNTTNNPNLTCIFVDDKIYSEANWQNIDPNSNFVETQQECDDLGLGSNKKLNIKVYPNPVTNKLFIEAENKSNLHYKLYGFTGKQLKQGQMFPVNMQDQAAGIYFVKLTKNHQSHTYKIIKQ